MFAGRNLVSNTVAEVSAREVTSYPAAGSAAYSPIRSSDRPPLHPSAHAAAKQSSDVGRSVANSADLQHSDLQHSDLQHSDLRHGAQVFFDYQDRAIPIRPHAGANLDSEANGFYQEDATDDPTVAALLNAAAQFKGLTVLPDSGVKTQVNKDSRVISLGASDVVVPTSYVGDVDTEATVAGGDMGALIEAAASKVDVVERTDSGEEMMMEGEEFNRLIKALVAAGPQVQGSFGSASSQSFGPGPGFHAFELATTPHGASRAVSGGGGDAGNSGGRYGDELPDTLTGTNVHTGGDGIGGTGGIDPYNIPVGKEYQGSGLLDQRVLTNFGRIRANVPGQTLELRSLGVPYQDVNKGTISAEAGGTLLINGKEFSNHSFIVGGFAGHIELKDVLLDQTAQGGSGAGTVSLQSGGLLSVTSSTIRGGTLSTAENSTTSLSGSTLSGVKVVANGPINVTGGHAATLSQKLGGSIDLNSTLSVNPEASAAGSTLTFEGAVAIASTTSLGKIQLGTGALLTGTAGSKLTVGSGVIVSGQGSIDTPFENNGTLAADVAGATLNVKSSGTNSGTLLAANGGTLSIENVTITQTATGLIKADGGDVKLTSVTVHGGAVATADHGSNVGTIFSNNSVLDQVTIPANTNLQIVPGTTSSMSLGFVNDGVVHIGSATDDSASTLDLTSPVIVRGTGKILLDSSFARLSGARLTNPAGHTLGGVGNISSPLSNSGTLLASLAEHGTSTVLNITSPVDSSGTIGADSGATLRLNKAVSLSGGSVFTASGASVIVNDGLTITGTVSKTGPGALVLGPTASFNLGSAGTLDLSQGALIRFDHSGKALAQTRQLIGRAFKGAPNAGPWTGPGISSAMLATAPMLALGYARAADVLGISGNQTAMWDGVLVNPSAVLVAQTYVGDTNLDGRVDNQDLSNAMAGLAAGTGGWANGDFNYDGFVTASDIQKLKDVIAAAMPTLGDFSNFNKPPLHPVTVAVPEPAAMLNLAAAAGVLLTRRRRR